MGKQDEKSSEALPEFEAALEEIEAIIDAIEGGQVNLEQSLSRYGRGMKLIAHCRSVLDRAEQKIKQITEKGSGDLEVGSE